MTNRHTQLGTMLCILIAAAGITAEAQHFSVAAGPPGSGLPSPSGMAPDDIFGAPGPFLVLPGAGPILPPGAPPTPYIDVDAFSYGRWDFEFGMVGGLEFSVSSLSAGMVGVPGSAVGMEVAGGALGPGDHTADIYHSTFTSSNTLLWDGDAIPNPIPAPPLGLLEPLLDDVDGWENNFFQDVMYFSVDIPSAPAAYGTPPFTGGDVYLWGLSGPGPYDAPGTFAMYAPAAALGLDLAGMNTDELDALQVFDDGDYLFASPSDVILFSLAPGSPALAAFGAGPEDVLMATGAGGYAGIYMPGAALGLMPGSDLNALAVTIIPEPVTGVLLLIGLGLVVLRRRN